MNGTHQMPDGSMMADSEMQENDVLAEIDSFLQNLSDEEIKILITRAGERLASVEGSESEDEGVTTEDFEREMM